MSAREKDLVARLLKQSILTVCKETVSYESRLEIDGIVCISLENDSQQIVIKVHELFQKTSDRPYSDSGISDNYDPKVIRSHQKFQKPTVHYQSSQSWEGTSYGSSEGQADDTHINDGSVCFSSGDDEEDDGNDNGVMETDYVEGADKVALEIKQEFPSKIVPTSVPIVRRLLTAQSHESVVKGSLSDFGRSKRASQKLKRSISYAGGRTTKDSSLVAQLNEVKKLVPTNVKDINCKRCGMVLADGPAFEQHNLLVHSTFTCYICYNTFTCRNNMKRHIRLHTGVKPYRCPKCPESFARKDDIKRHVLRHSFDKPYRCNLCKKGYMDRACVRNHMKKEHNSKLLHICPQCGEGFNASSEFQSHKKTHPELKNYQCSLCDFTGTNSLMYHKHMLTHGQPRTYSCTVCVLTFADPFAYSLHMKKHRLEEGFKTYQCCFCDNVLSSYDQFVRHEHSHTQSKTHACSVCQKQFRWPSSLKEHMLTHQAPAEGSDVSSQYWCTECNQGFASETLLQEHISKTHEGEMPMNSSLLSDEDFSDFEGDSGSDGKEDEMKLEPASPAWEGDSVERSTRRKSSRQVVTPVVYSQDNDVDSSREGSGSPHDAPEVENSTGFEGSEVKVKCEVTSDGEEASVLDDDATSDKRSTTDAVELALLQYSKTSVLGMNTEFSMGEGLGSYGNLSNNSSPSSTINLKVRAPGFEKVVTPDVLFRMKSPFTCEVCEETFPDFESFDQHGSSVHRRFICEYCGKVFTAKPNRERHVRYHTGEKPYKCEICGQSFFRGDDLKYHRTTRHSSVKPFSCNACKMCFSWPKDLERHMKSNPHHR